MNRGRRSPITSALVALALVLSSLPSGAQMPPQSSPNVPSWLHDAVIYQIYPQTFADSDGDGIGDLAGIIGKLDYVKSLGVDAIWLNPFFDSPFNDAGYDIRDYYKVAPRYGTNEDAKRLFDEAHKRGLKVIFDYVVSYTAIDNPWFVDSTKQEPNAHSNWFIWTDNAWKSEEGEFCNRFVHGYGQRNGNFMRNFYWSSPALNFGFNEPDPTRKWQLPTNHPEILALRAELKRVLRFWMDMGADGFRADMAGALVKGQGSDAKTKEFWREIRAILDESYPEAFMVSEWSHPKDALDGAFHADFFHWFDGYNDIAQKESWRILNGYSEGHSFFDAEGKGNIANFLAKYMEQYEPTRTKGYITLPLGNHDVSRMNVRRTTDELEMLMAFGITMPGVPFIYYGNEIGMRQLYGKPQVEGAYYPRSGARTPMQWAPGANLGFSTADATKLYLPVDDADDAPTVAAQEADPTSLLNRVRKLVALKKQQPGLAAHAAFAPLYARPDTYPFIYTRGTGKDTLLVVMNPAARTETAEVTLPSPFRKLELLAGRATKNKKTGQALSIEVPGQTWALYRVAQK